MRESGIEVVEGVGGTGVLGVLRRGDGPTVLVRADMDALPVGEETGLAYASEVDGVMHASDMLNVDGITPEILQWIKAHTKARP